MEPKTVLVTGAAGAIGKVTVAGLIARGHRVRGFDRVAMPELADAQVGDITDPVAVRKAVAGMQTVIHLAATPDVADFISDLVPNNIIATEHMLAACRDAQVERVMLASTCRVTQRRDWTKDIVRIDDPFAPADHYSLSKCCVELMGEMYAAKFGLSVINVRLGWFVRNQQEGARMDKNPIGQRIYLSRGDTVRFFNGAVEATGIACAAFYVTGPAGGKPVFDLEPAKRLLGYQPRDSWPEDFPWPVVTS